MTRRSRWVSDSSMLAMISGWATLGEIDTQENISGSRLTMMSPRASSSFHSTIWLNTISQRYGSLSLARQNRRSSHMLVIVREPHKCLLLWAPILISLSQEWMESYWLPLCLEFKTWHLLGAKSLRLTKEHLIYSECRVQKSWSRHLQLPSLSSKRLQLRLPQVYLIWLPLKVVMQIHQRLAKKGLSITTNFSPLAHASDRFITSINS